MLKIRVRDVRCDDWHWLYIEDKLTCESGVGHELSVEDFVEEINAYLEEKSHGAYLESIYRIDFEEWWVSDEYAESGLPDNLNGIPEEEFV